MKVETDLVFDKESKSYVNAETGEVVTGDEFLLNKRIRYKMDTVMHFGKFTGKTVAEILYDVDNKGYKYLYWMFDTGFQFDNKVINASNKFTEKRMLEKDFIPLGVDPATRQVEFIRKENLHKMMEDKQQRQDASLGFREKGMLKNLKSRLDEKHWDAAFDDEDISIGDLKDVDDWDL